MESNLKKEVSQEKVNRFLEETKVYFDCLEKIQSLKPKKYLFNTQTGEVTNLQDSDTVLELDIKNKIESIKQNIFNND